MTRIDTNQDKGNGIQIPPASLAIIRVNSCDSWTEPLAARCGDWDPRMTRITRIRTEGMESKFAPASLAIIRVNSCDSWTEPFARDVQIGIHE
jgi:hypothetical protein